MQKTTKQDLIDAAAATGIPKATAAEAVEHVLACIEESLAAGVPVRLTGIGTLSPYQAPGRSGTAPNGERWIMGPAIKVRFSAAGGLKARLNAG